MHIVSILISRQSLLNTLQSQYVSSLKSFVFFVFSLYSILYSLQSLVQRLQSSSSLVLSLYSTLSSLSLFLVLNLQSPVSALHSIVSSLSQTLRFIFQFILKFNTIQPQVSIVSSLQCIFSSLNAIIYIVYIVIKSLVCIVSSL